jgi:CheY-like chemotaxis protein
LWIGCEAATVFAQGEPTVRTPPRILIVDDNATNVKILQARLGSEGYEVVSAADGEEGLAAARTLAPDLILLDLMMPEMDGFEFIEELRKRPDGANLPVVVLTAKDLTEKDRQRLRGTVENVLQKSGQTNEVVSEVRRVLERSGAHVTTGEP